MASVLVNQQTEENIHYDEQKNSQTHHAKGVFDESADHSTSNNLLPLQED
jgi:hypothetical protein